MQPPGCLLSQAAVWLPMDDVFKALADPGRRRLLDSLNARNGQSLRELCAELDMARQSVSKHLAVLEGAGLVTTVREGRRKLHYLNAAPIDAISERWISRYHRGRVRALTDLKSALEEPKMAEFVYTTYIKTTPEDLWRALTDPAFTRRYWGVELRSDWEVGSELVWEQRGVTIADPEQVVLESDPPRRLSYTFHTFTPEFGATVGVSDELAAAPQPRPAGAPVVHVPHVHARVRRDRRVLRRADGRDGRRAAVEGHVRD